MAICRPPSFLCLNGCGYQLRDRSYTNYGVSRFGLGMVASGVLLSMRNNQRFCCCSWSPQTSAREVEQLSVFHISHSLNKHSGAICGTAYKFCSQLCSFSRQSEQILIRLALRLPRCKNQDNSPLEGSFPSSCMKTVLSKDCPRCLPDYR
jgi:hypothetical protein